MENLEAWLVVGTLSGSSYIGSDLTSTLNLKPKRKERRSIEQMFGTVDKVVEVYEVMIVSKSDSFKMKIECINAERDVITHLPNPNIEKLKRAQPRLRKSDSLRRKLKTSCFQSIFFLESKTTTKSVCQKHQSLEKSLISQWPNKPRIDSLWR